MQGNSIPPLGNEERRRALEIGMQARKRYAAIKDRVRTGELSITDALDEEDAQRIRVASLLRCAPGVGRSTLARVMSKAHIAENRRVSGLGARQREALARFERDGWKTS